MSVKMSYELLILLKFKLLQYIYYNILFQLYFTMQGKLIVINLACTTAKEKG